MKVRVGYVEEPPFYWSEDGRATGADIELAEIVLRGAGATSIEFVPTTFDELIPGLRADRWEMNVPIFVTPERSALVAFSRPVWSLVDGLVVRRGDVRRASSYTDVAMAAGLRLGVIPGQVQVAAAEAAGVRPDQLVEFPDQPSAIVALQTGDIDAFAATAVGNRAVVQRHPDLDQVALVPAAGGALVGAFSFRLDSGLRTAVDDQLAAFLGSPGHRESASRFGITSAEIDPIVG